MTTHANLDKKKTWLLKSQ